MKIVIEVLMTRIHFSPSKTTNDCLFDKTDLGRSDFLDTPVQVDLLIFPDYFLLPLSLRLCFDFATMHTKAVTISPSVVNVAWL